MRLSADGPRIRGTYAYAGQSRLRGEVTEGELHFTYEQPDGEVGEGVFRLGVDGDSFDGSWTSRGGRGGPWRGTRVLPEAGRRWLVVLEANWEGGLHEAEYSYGEMLRSFFTREPKVAVRHRFVSDLADLRRWCAEVVYLAEPVVLYLSSHGTEEGISLGVEEAGAEELIAALADLPDLELLHFGSCSVMGGEIPTRITDAREGAARFPISGFTRPADWAGSAVVDFTFLELVLVRGLAPHRALEATREMVSFARESSEGPIAGSGLAIHAPRSAGGE